ncbi:DEAD/DEAH box helicase family protein [Thalassomonas sp. M1454]|uniref:DEAD/DEAH box helicase family protein n=1 Tax=Thalassomonas sp. M1454 TaxID=2594477 RepID=UPI00117C1226|nr:DEAD/DEAH box helicase family protein [Thalassomonas sp. M1454]TRX56690.1 DEAD/DEAH box helicase [Thalassomonas sp. M1454]
MSFNKIDFPYCISTSESNPVDSLFDPLLSSASTYDVAVGYFTSGWLKDTAEGMAKFALNGGKSRWVISPELNAEDAKVIISEPIQSYNVIDQNERSVMEMILSLKENTREELCSLIAAGILNFKIAVPKKGNGLFHAKIALAKDNEGNEIAYSGSYNHTSAAKSNWERIDIFSSPNDTPRIENIRDSFNLLWSNQDPIFDVFIPSKNLINEIERYKGENYSSYLSASSDSDISEIKLRPYQEEAIRKWGEHNGRGTFVMATGSGKTITALATIQKLQKKIVIDNKKPLFTLIILPLKHLLDQWHTEALGFGFNAIKCYENSSEWSNKLAQKIGIQTIQKSGHVIAMVTNSTFAKDNFQKEITKIKSNFMIVADEAHNLGSDVYINSLPSNAQFRLALSATPDRHNDSKGTSKLFDYFGKPVIEFSLEDAISAGYLCPYEYHPHLCLLSEAEYAEYLYLVELINIEKPKSKIKGEKTKEHNRLLGKRTDLIAGVESKLELLEELLSEQKSNGEVKHTLVYCGMRRGEDNERHIERTVKLVGKQGIKTRKFTAEESLDERKEILDLFSTGELEAIAAIKCLDEGVDVPATRVAYILASTTNPREYIQRRGRVLRKSQGKDKAIIHDFLVAPPSSQYREDDMIEKELERAFEFSNLAINRNESNEKLIELAKDNGVDKWL